MELVWLYLEQYNEKIINGIMNDWFYIDVIFSAFRVIKVF